MRVTQKDEILLGNPDKNCWTYQLDLGLMQPERSTEEKTTMKVGLITMMSAFLLALPAFLVAPAAMAGNDECLLGEDLTDTDGDGVIDCADNCVNVANASPNDCDTDMDGYGNACDGDFDNGGIPRVNTADLNGFMIPALGTGNDTGVGENMSCDGIPSVAAGDFANFFVPQFTLGSPGPSGLACAGTVPCP
jgi:hypothetical protein